MNTYLLSYYVGIFIVFFSHAYTLYSPSKPLMSMKSHSCINLAAVVLIAYYFMHKEHFIQ